MGKLQQAQDNSLQTSNASLGASEKIAETLANQLKILKIEQDARIEQQNRRPILELTANSFEAKGFKIKRLVNGAGAPSELIRPMMKSNGEATVRFYLRNVGTAPAFNVTVTANTSSEVFVNCIDLPFYKLDTNKSTGTYYPCQEPFLAIPPIYPRPTDRAEHRAFDSMNPDFDGAYDVGFDVALQIPADIKYFDLEIMIRADQLVPLRFRVQCHTAII
jgi:hypothetical protein